MNNNNISSEYLKSRNDLFNNRSNSYNSLYDNSETSAEDETLYTGEGDIEGSDPSKKSYDRGYYLEPYEMRYIAKKGESNMISRLRKKAAVEIRDITFSASNYVDELLSIWKEADGSLQDFFDAFTSNGKVNNRTKKQMIEILRDRGYEDIYPTLLDERVKYANALNDIQISDESLNSMEKMLSGTQEKLSNPNINSLNSTNIGYDEISQMRDDFGIRPEQYEINLSSRLSKKKQ